MLANLQKLLHILNKNQKKKVAGLGVMIFVGALMEMIGVGLIMPVVEGVMAPQQLLDKSYIRFLQRFLPFDTADEWLLFLIAAIIGVYIIKNATFCCRPMCSRGLSTKTSPIRSATCWRNI